MFGFVGKSVVHVICFYVLKYEIFGKNDLKDATSLR